MMKKSFKIIICFISSLALLTGFSPGFININKAIAAEDNNLSELDSYLSKLKASAPIPGFSVVVVKGDRIIYSKGFGEEIIGLGKPMTENSPTAIGSLTKSFTAMAMMQLVEQRKLSLDDPVIKYIPWFKTLDKENSDKITIRMLLSNTSGMPSIDRWVNMPESSEDAMEKSVRHLSSFPLNRDPGEDYEYSNEGFNTAGVIIEQVSGMSYSEYIEKNILEPLKMHNSTTDINRFDELGVLYGHNGGIEEAIPAGRFVNTSVLAAGSEFRASAENMGHYLIALLKGGTYEGQSVLSKESIEELWTPHVSFPVGTSKDLTDDGVINYCLGWMSSVMDGRKVIHHGGNTLTASSYTILYPEKDLAVSVLYNLNSLDHYKYVGIYSVANNILHIVSGEPIDDSIIVDKNDPTQNSYELPADQNSSYVGDYVSSSGDWKLKVSEDEKGRLISSLENTRGTAEFLLDFASPSIAYMRNISTSHSARFKITSDGTVTGIEIPGLGNLSRVNDNMYNNYTKVHSPGSEISFYIPKDYIIRWEDNNFFIENTEEDIEIQGQIIKTGLYSFDKFVENAASDGNVIDENLEHTENLAGHVYREKSFSVSKDGSLYQRILVYTELKDMAISLSSDLPYSKSGEVIRNALLPIMYSLD